MDESRASYILSAPSDLYKGVNINGIISNIYILNCDKSEVNEAVQLLGTENSLYVNVNHSISLHSKNREVAESAAKLIFYDVKSGIEYFIEDAIKMIDKFIGGDEDDASIIYSNPILKLKVYDGYVYVDVKETKLCKTTVSFYRNIGSEPIYVSNSIDLSALKNLDYTHAVNSLALIIKKAIESLEYKIADSVVISKYCKEIIASL